MARLFTSGFEINSTTPGVEWSDYGVGASISSTSPRNGNYKLLASSPTSGQHCGAGITYSPAGGATSYFHRAYINVTTFPSTENAIMMINDASSSSTPIQYITIDNTGTLKLYDEDGQISGTISVITNVWYCIEMRLNTAGAGYTDIVEARINGAVFSTSSTRNISSGPTYFRVGLNCLSEANTTGSISFDDIAINDNVSVSPSNYGYPGEGNVLLMSPTAAGGANTWLKTDLVTPGDANNYQLVNELPPNDSTSFVASSTSFDYDLYNLTDLSYPTEAWINTVQISTRLRNDVATASGLSVFIVLLLDGNLVGGSVEIIPNSTTWKTVNSNVDGTSFGKILTKTIMDNLQVGMFMGNGSSPNFIEVSSMWVSVDWISSPGISNTSSMMSYYPGF